MRRLLLIIVIAIGCLWYGGFFESPKPRPFKCIDCPNGKCELDDGIEEHPHPSPLPSRERGSNALPVDGTRPILKLPIPKRVPNKAATKFKSGVGRIPRENSISIGGRKLVDGEFEAVLDGIEQKQTKVTKEFESIRHGLQAHATDELIEAPVPWTPGPFVMAKPKDTLTLALSPQGRGDRRGRVSTRRVIRSARSPGRDVSVNNQHWEVQDKKGNRYIVESVAVEGGRVCPFDSQVEIAIDLPGNLHVKNVEAEVDKKGCCVFASINACANWSGVEELEDFLEWQAERDGGGYPEKVDASIREKTHGEFKEYVQATGEQDFLRVIDWAFRNGRPAAVTYGYGERYGFAIAHMVTLVHFDAKYACVLDNNFIGENAYEWMTREEFLRRARMMGGPWCVVLLRAPPPLVPVTQRSERRANRLVD